MKSPTDEAPIPSPLDALLAEIDALKAKLDLQAKRIALLEEWLTTPAKPDPGGTFWLPAREAAARLGVTVYSLGRLRRQGKIPSDCWAQLTCRSYEYRESWVYQARKLRAAATLYQMAPKPKKARK